MILVTGFGSYREAINASGALVQSLRDDLPETLSHLREKLVFEVITCDDTSRETEHQSLETQLSELIIRYQPALCVHTGQAPSRNKITIEKIAANTFMRQIIDPARPVAYWSNLPGMDGMKEVLEAHRIPAVYSFYGGQHLCNHILYSSLYFAQSRGLRHKSGFIHIPVLPEQVIERHCESACMPIDMLRKALSLIINQAFESQRADKDIPPST